MGRMFLTSGNYRYVRISLLGLAILTTATTGEKYEGESCETNYLTPGICRLDTDCPEIRKAIELKKIKNTDPVHCSYWQQHEVICCPIEGSVTTSTTSRAPTTEVNLFKTNPITTTSEKPDFWLDLLNTTTEASQPDFWLDLLNTTTKTPQPDFWLDLLNTTTTSTTPAPFIFDGKEVDLNSEYVDLHQLLKKDGRLPVERSERLENQPHIDNNNLNVRNPNNNHRQNNDRNSQPSRPNGNQNIHNGNINWNGEVINPNNVQKPNNGRNILPMNNPNMNPNAAHFPNQNQNRRDVNTNWNGNNHRNDNPRNANGNNNRGNGRVINTINRPTNVVNPNQNVPRVNQPNWPSDIPSNTNWQNQNPNNINQEDWELQQASRHNQFSRPNGNPSNANWQNQNSNVINPNARQPPNWPNANPSNTNWQNQNPNNINQEASQLQVPPRRNQFNRPNGNPLNTNWQNQNANTWQQQEQLNTLSNNLPNHNIPTGQHLNWPNGNPTNTNWQNQNPNNMNQIRQQQSSNLNNNLSRNPGWRPNVPQIDDLETAASTNSLHEINQDIGLPNGNIWPSSRPAPEQNPNMDPINTVFNNLVNSGMDIVKAKLENVDKLHDQFGFPQDLNTLTTTTTPRTTLTDPFAPFEFRPQPDDIFDTETIGVWNLETETSNQRPTPASGTNGTEVGGRLRPRAAVAACMEIEKNLSPGLTPHILDGTPVAVGEYPHMAAIGYPPVGDDKSTNYEFRCGGTLISNKFVLTAAHCVNNRDATPVIVRLGAANFSNPVELADALEIRIKNTFIHPNYTNSRKYDDIALLELESEISVTTKVAPVCLYTESTDPPNGTRLYVTGWGTINLQTRQSSENLLKARLEIIPLDSCNTSYLEGGSNRQLNRGVIGTQLCAGDPGFTKDACQGDSGGPLNLVIDEALFLYRVVGVISTGFGCASSVPGLYTRVSSYLDYIEEIVWPNLRT